MSPVGRTVRIALIHLMQETDTFNPVPTTLADFEIVALLEGDEMLSRVDSNGPIAGYLEAVGASEKERFRLARGRDLPSAEVPRPIAETTTAYRRDHRR